MKYVFIAAFLCSLSPIFGQSIVTDAIVDRTPVKALRISITKDSVNIAGVFSGKIVSTKSDNGRVNIKCLFGDVEIKNNVISIERNEKVTFIRFID